jgi:hypothetical protein
VPRAAGMLFAIDEECLMQLLIPYRIILANDGSKPFGDRRTMLGTRTSAEDYTPRKNCGFPIACEYWWQGQVKLTDGIYKIPSNGPVGVRNDPGAIRIVAESLAQAIPYADHAFSILTYLMELPRGPLNQLVEMGKKRGCAQLMEDHSNYINDDRAIKFCYRCGCNLQFGAYTAVKGEERCFWCLNCAKPDIVVKSTLICMDQDDGTDGIAHLLKISEKIEPVDLIKTGTEGRKNCLALLEERKKSSEFIVISDASLPSMRIDGGEGIIKELNQDYVLTAEQSKFLADDDYKLIGLGRKNDKKNNNHKSQGKQKCQVSTAADMLQSERARLVGDVEILPYASGSYSREAILVDAIERQQPTIQELIHGLQDAREEEQSEEGERNDRKALDNEGDDGSDDDDKNESEEESNCKNNLESDKGTPLCLTTPRDDKTSSSSSHEIQDISRTIVMTRSGKQAATQGDEKKTMNMLSEGIDLPQDRTITTTSKGNRANKRKMESDGGVKNSKICNLKMKNKNTTKYMRFDYQKFDQRQKGEGNSKPHCDPAEAMNKAFKTFHSRRDIDNQCLACWLIIKPEFFPTALDWGLEKAELILPKNMKNCADFLNNIARRTGTTAAWVVEQKHGDTVHVPIGYAHVVTNVGPCVKVAMDYVPVGHFHQCMISHLFVQRQFNSKLTEDYVSIINHTWEKFRHNFDMKYGMPKFLSRYNPPRGDALTSKEER